MLTKIFFCALLTGSAITLMAQRNNNEVLIERHSMATAGIQRVQADADAGNISLEGVNNSDARIEVYAWSRKNEKETKQAFKDLYDVSTTTKDGTLTISEKGKTSSTIRIYLLLYGYLYPLVPLVSWRQTVETYIV